MNNRALHRLVLLGLLACLLAVGAPQPQPARAADERPVMAFYYPWYEPSDWSYNRMSDLPAPTYSSGDDATILRHIQQADDAGINALICAWFGPNEDRINKRCRRLMDLIEQSGRPLKVAIMPEQAAWRDLNSVDALTGALDVLQRDWMGRPSYFRFGGKPVVFWFNPGSLGGVDTWKQLRGRADPNGGQFWFGGTDNFGYLDVYDALYYFDITWERQPGAAMASYAGRLSGYNRSRGANKPFIATAMPGYDDLKVRNGHQRDRENGNYYRSTWQTAIDRNAAAVVITSFNEFFEGSHIEPSERYGDLYLRLTREQSDRFRAGTPAPQPQPQPPGTGPCQDFPETGRRVCGRLLEYWRQNGGLPVFGYPITDQTEQTIEGRAVQVQVFERNRLELHPQNARPYDVLLGRLGADSLAAQSRDWNSFPKGDPAAPHYFAQTGHAIAPQFWGYWSSHGLEFDGRRGSSFNESLALFGLPLSEATMEVNPTNGQMYLTQHFERARFEYHPENANTPYEVLLGLLGRELSGIR
ncbi:MAG: hypothetical protein OHK0022_17650 [Roseiflexaceae bacterium]